MKYILYTNIAIHHQLFVYIIFSIVLPHDAKWRLNISRRFCRWIYLMWCGLENTFNVLDAQQNLCSKFYIPPHPLGKIKPYEFGSYCHIRISLNSASPVLCITHHYQYQLIVHNNILHSKHYIQYHQRKALHVCAQ